MLVSLISGHLFKYCLPRAATTTTTEHAPPRSQASTQQGAGTSSPGLIAGIVIGAIVVAIVVVLFILYKRGKLQRAQAKLSQLLGNHISRPALSIPDCVAEFFSTCNDTLVQQLEAFCGSSFLALNT